VGASGQSSIIAFGRDKLKGTTKTQGDFNLSNRFSTKTPGDFNLSNRFSTKTPGDFNLSNRFSVEIDGVMAGGAHGAIGADGAAKDPARRFIQPVQLSVTLN
jgi:hypothetical protein